MNIRCVYADFAHQGFVGKGCAVLLAVCAVSVMSFRSAAHAQLHRITDPVATPASSLILQDDASAIDVNPAGLGFVPAWSLTYVHAQVNERAEFMGQGDAVSFATPLLFGLSLGATVQSIRPGSLATRVGEAARDRALFGLGLALAPTKRFALGVSGRGFVSGDPQLDGLSTFDLGLTWHAADWLGFSLTGRDLLASRKGFGTSGLDLHASLLAGWQVRPFGTSDLVLDMNVGVSGNGRVGGRGGLGVRIPHFGYASSVVELERIGKSDQVYRVLAELNATFETLSLGAGVIAGEAYGKGPGAYAMARFEGRPRTGVLPRPRILDVELGELNERGILRMSLYLEAALRDERVAGVLLRPRGGSLGSAYAQELRLLISALRAAGKRVACHLEDASGSQYYACAAAEAVFIDPAGSIRLLGAAADVILFGDTLRKIGLNVDIVRIGDYKSAPEQYTQHSMSEPSREELQVLLSDVHSRVLHDLGSDLRVEPGRIAAIMDRGPHLAHHAMADKLVTRSADETALKAREEAVFEGRSVVSQLPARARRDWYAGPRVGVVMIDGSIVDGSSVDIPLLGLHMSGGHTVVRAIDAMIADPLVRAIVLRVDSPGGAVLASDQIWRAVRRARKVKPVVVSMGAVAASGGYYVASAGDEIWADPSTITGSIGAFYGKVDVSELAQKLGVGIEVFKLGKRSGGDSIYHPFTPDERATLADRLRTYYRLFLRRVAEGRRMRVEQVDALGRGRVYTGDAALRLGLVDHLGGFASALMRARQLGRVSESAEVTVLPKRPEGLLDYVFGELSGSAAPAPQVSPLVPAHLRATLARAATLLQLGAATPLALLPYTLEP